jgi:hypothetical protein
MIRFRVAATRFSRLCLSLADIPVMIKSISIVPLVIHKSTIINKIDGYWDKRAGRTKPGKIYLTCRVIRCTLLHGNIKKPEGLYNIPHFNLSTVRAKLSHNKKCDIAKKQSLITI